MADKPIGGIDVSGCKYRDTYTNFCKAEKDDVGECYTICTGNDCYYKQLQRKKQECKKLKKVSCEFKNYCTCDTEKFLQTLDTIKEIAEKHKVTAHCDYLTDMDEILQKINEVI